MIPPGALRHRSEALRSAWWKEKKTQSSFFDCFKLQRAYWIRQGVRTNGIAKLVTFPRKKKKKSVLLSKWRKTQSIKSKDSLLYFWNALSGLWNLVKEQNHIRHGAWQRDARWNQRIEYTHIYFKCTHYVYFFLFMFSTRDRYTCSVNPAQPPTEISVVFMFSSATVTNLIYFLKVNQLLKSLILFQFLYT